MRCFALCVLLCATSAAAQEIDRLQAARDFGFEGLKLSTPLAEFYKRYPSAVLNEDGCDPKAKVVEYETRGKVGSSHGTARATFCDGKLYQIQIFYTNAELAKLGGDTVPYQKLKAKFGEKNATIGVINNGTTATWDFPEINRRIICVTMPGTICDVAVIDMQVQAEVQRRQVKAADLGF